MSSRRLSVEQPPDICRAAAGYLENLRIKLTQTFSRGFRKVRSELCKKVRVNGKDLESPNLARN